jgi:hypothetical protein
MPRKKPPKSFLQKSAWIPLILLLSASGTLMMARSAAAQVNTSPEQTGVNLLFVYKQGPPAASVDNCDDSRFLHPQPEFGGQFGCSLDVYADDGTGYKRALGWEYAGSAIRVSRDNGQVALFIPIEHSVDYGGAVHLARPLTTRDLSVNGSCRAIHSNRKGARSRRIAVDGRQRNLPQKHIRSELQNSTRRSRETCKARKLLFFRRIKARLTSYGLILSCVDRFTG